MKTFCWVTCYFFIFNVSGVHQSRRRTFEKDNSLSEYIYNDAFLQEYQAGSLSRCGQFCLDDNCSSFTFERLKERCRTHQQRLYQKQNRLHSPNSSYYVIINQDPKDCSEISTDGYFMIHPIPTKPLLVYCHEGWTVIQRRFDGTVNFYRGWNAYKNFFGNNGGEYWLGLENIRLMISLGLTRLRINLMMNNNKSYHAVFTSFDIANETNLYRLKVHGYSGNAGDSLTFHNGKPFSTFDCDNDDSNVNCAEKYKGAWWYGEGPSIQCYDSSLNALYGARDSKHIIWYGVSDAVAVSKTSMEIRKPS